MLLEAALCLVALALRWAAPACAAVVRPWAAAWLALALIGWPYDARVRAVGALAGLVSLHASWRLLVSADAPLRCPHDGATLYLGVSAVVLTGLLVAGLQRALDRFID